MDRDAARLERADKFTLMSTAVSAVAVALIVVALLVALIGHFTRLENSVMIVVTGGTLLLWIAEATIETTIGKREGRFGPRVSWLVASGWAIITIIFIHTAVATF